VNIFLKKAYHTVSWTIDIEEELQFDINITKPYLILDKYRSKLYLQEHSPNKRKITREWKDKCV